LNNLRSHNDFEHKIFDFNNYPFEAIALDVFRFQYHENEIYQQYVKSLSLGWEQVANLSQIPFLPISFFKTHPIRTTEFQPELVFESSGTTQTGNSRHEVKKKILYERSFITAFEQFYGPVEDWCVIGLLPSYLERQHSSLVLMVDELIKLSGHPKSGFFLYEHEKLFKNLNELQAVGQKTLLIGVSFALLDFAEKYSMNLKRTVVMETGGMKGRRKELTRAELHEFLRKKLGLVTIHSEYGMTELLSQGYSSGHGIFRSPAWMRIGVREEDDPFAISWPEELKEDEIKNGVINVIDLANLYSCSFIATEDMGKIHGNGTFEVLGRLDNSDVRGCSLMVL
jgi:hypothetical protein